MAPEKFYRGVCQKCTHRKKLIDYAYPRQSILPRKLPLCVAHVHATFKGDASSRLVAPPSSEAHRWRRNAHLAPSRHALIREGARRQPLVVLKASQRVFQIGGISLEGVNCGRPRLRHRTVLPWQARARQARSSNWLAGQPRSTRAC